MVPIMSTHYLVLSKPGKQIVYHGPLTVALGTKASYVTPNMYTCLVRIRVADILISFSQLSRGVGLVHHNNLRVLGIQARLELIAVMITASRIVCNITKFWPFSLHQPSVAVDLHLLSGLHSRSTQAPDLVSGRPRHFTSLRGYILILNINLVMATISPGFSTPSCTSVSNMVIIVSTPRCAIMVNIIANAPNGVNITKYCYDYAHARHDAIGSS